MPVFPINTDTFKRSFLSGDGSFVLKSDQDLWTRLIATGGKFLPTVGRIADINFSFNNDRRFRFGPADGLQLVVAAEAMHQIQLIWPGQEDVVLKAHMLSEFLTADRLYLRLLFSAKGDIAADGAFPTGPLSATFGVGAGGNVAYERLKVYDSNRTAKEILDDLFAGIRLPQQVDSAADIPDPGEILITRFGGYLKLHAGLNWGYQLTGSSSVEFNRLNLDLESRLRLMAAAKIEYRIAGDLSIETRRGERDGWVKFIIRKNRDAQFDFTADFGLDNEIILEGLPRSSDEFLIRLIGADAETVLGYFHRSQEYLSLDRLEERLSPLVKGFVHDWSKMLIDEALSDRTLQAFLARARDVADAYNNLDARIIDLYYAYLKRIPALQKTLDLLAGVSNAAELIDLTEEDNADHGGLDTWEVIQLVWGTGVYPLLLLNERFAEFSLFFLEARDFINEDATKPVRDFIARLKGSFPLDSLLEELGKIKTAEDLERLADQKLQDLAGRLIGKAFAEIRQTELAGALKDLQSSLEKIEQFKQNWYEKLTTAANRKFTFDLHFAYTRAPRNEHLLDIEFDLNNTEGRRLARLAATGDFREALRRYNSRYVKVGRGVFTQSLTTSAHLQINVMGWGYDSLKQLSQKAEHAIEEASGGLLHVYASETSIEQRVERGRKFKEMIESNFLFRAIGETFQPEGAPLDQKAERYPIQILRSLAVQYDLLSTDERTGVDELTRYLDLAEFLGLFTKRSRAAFIGDLMRQFPAGFGKVKLTYVVRYNDAALRMAFASISNDELHELARQTVRQIIASKYIGMRQENRLARVGFAYLSPSLHDEFDTKGFTELHKFKSVTLPTWFTRGSSIKVGLSAADIQLLITLCNIENIYAQRLVHLDRVLDQAIAGRQPIPQAELEEAARRFVETADDLDEWRENAFFVIFDKLVQVATGGEARRESAMVLEIVPEGKEKVTKILLPQ